jgi:EpsI family protein
MNTMVRLLIVAAILAGIQVAKMTIDRDRQPGAIRMPDRDVAALPARLGTWVGRDEPMDPKLFIALQAAAVVNRRYQEEGGGSIAMQVAVFPVNEIEPPHPPQLCYTKAGWVLAEQHPIDLNVPGQLSRKAQFVAFEQEGQRIHVLYWYQVGDANFVDTDGMRRERWKLFGKRVWPPIVKVMLQSSTASPTLAETQLRKFGEAVIAWTKDLN